MVATTTRRGVFPGSFNPPTTAHLAISEAVVVQHHLDVLVWSVSRVALAKEDVQRPRLVDRIAVLEDMAEKLDWLEISVTEAQLLSEIAAGFDVIVMGADKWQQIHDPVFYGDDPSRRDASIAALPTVAIAARPPHGCPADLVLDLPDWVGAVSSTQARTTDPALMAPEAARFDAATGAWTDPAHYEAWLRAEQGD
ncbi:hypothetical protein [Candidatus Poriferisodalis multihospitum]|uniref:hypothetical protein n=1 Tax=Candidatus Poriferisodalis multihospitum TaxID=2983191 RepID=UPI002B256C82|nr:hypothetical protein [Candidatus Poriferisodalis multihospitum]